jgi:hypothetical protein
VTNGGGRDGRSTPEEDDERAGDFYRECGGESGPSTRERGERERETDVWGRVFDPGPSHLSDGAPRRVRHCYFSPAWTCM